MILNQNTSDTDFPGFCVDYTYCAYYDDILFYIILGKIYHFGWYSQNMKYESFIILKLIYFLQIYLVYVLLLMLS